MKILSSRGRYDEYFGQTAAKMFGDKIIEKFKGWRISKRQDESDTYDEDDKFVGLIAAADILGIDDFFDVLYQGFHIQTVQACRMLNSNPGKRGKLSELLISNYPVAET